MTYEKVGKFLNLISAFFKKNGTFSGSCSLCGKAILKYSLAKHACQKNLPKINPKLPKIKVNAYLKHKKSLSHIIFYTFHPCNFSFAYYLDCLSVNFENEPIFENFEKLS